MVITSALHQPWDAAAIITVYFPMVDITGLKISWKCLIGLN
jgi:hypothetical protein